MKHNHPLFLFHCLSLQYGVACYRALAVEPFYEIEVNDNFFDLSCDDTELQLGYVSNRLRSELSSEADDLYQSSAKITHYRCRVVETSEDVPTPVCRKFPTYKSTSNFLFFI